MSISKRLLAAVMSFTTACSAMVAGTVQTVTAADYPIAELYHTTTSQESKEDPNEMPFRVFEIYDAFYGTTTTETTTTTTVPTTTTATTTTTKAATKPVTTVASTTGRNYSATTMTVSTSVPEEVPSKVLSWGVDVSRYQNVIEWDKVKAAGIDFAIMQAGYGRYLNQEDYTFDTNMQNAQAAGIECGAYWYSYAMSPEEALLEAQVCCEIIKDYKFTFPVYFDIEEPAHSLLSVAEISAIVETFCGYLESQGYYAGVYSYATFLESKIYRSVLEKYDVWVAQYGTEAPIAYTGDYGIWQYTPYGIIDGIPTQVDLNNAYRNYPFLTSPESYSGFGRDDTGALLPPVTKPAQPQYPKKGFDVSASQGDINWENVKDSGVDFTILCAGSGTKADAKFAVNYQNASAVGIEKGAYWKAKSTTVEGIKAEAETFEKVISGLSFEYPIYLDLSDTSISNSGLSKDEIADLIDAFCGYFEGKGYYIGVAGFENFLNGNIDAALYEKYDVWIASHGVGKPDFSSKYGVWQYSGTGSIAGVNGAVCLDYCYRDYASVMKSYHLNGF